MTHTLKARAELVGTKLSFYAAERVQAWLATQKDGTYTVSIGRERDRLSDRQRRYYFGVVVPILAEYFGYEPDEMHEALKWHFLRTHPDSPLPTVKSITKFSTAEMEEYLRRVRTWASSEYGVYIPEPNEDVTIGV